MTAAEEAATRGIAHLLRVVGDAGRTAGPAFLVTETLAVTAPAVPGTASRVTVETVPGGPDRRAEAAVVRGSEPGLVLLEIAERLPGTSPARLVAARPEWGRRVDALGFPAGIDTGAWARPVLRAPDATGRIQLDPDPGGYALGAGFAGAAVLDPAGGVLGMIGEPAGTLIPAHTLLGAVARLAGRPELAELARPRSPFRGLAAYGESDGAVFHARREESAAVAELLGNHRWVSIVGDSGCGKSSLIRAGVVPVLRARGYTCSVIRGSAQETGPGRGEGDLLERVRRDLEAHRGARHLLVLDQVEEILATPHGGEVLRLVASADLPSTTRVVLAMRPDALGTLLGDERHAPLTRSDSVYTLSPLDTTGLRTVLTAEQAVPVAYEDGLVDLILRDVAAASTPMPLLGYLMERLWDRCWEEARRADAPFMLTHAAYHSLGGVTGAIGVRAEQVWAGLDDEDRAHGRALLRRLVDITAADAVPVRRAVPRSEIGPAQWRVAQRLATERLLGVRGDAGREVVEVVHEVLMSRWDRYARWIDEDRAFLLWRAGLGRNVSRWETHDRDAALLPGDAALEEAGVWERAYRGDLDDRERGYLTAGRAARRRRIRSERFRRGRRGAVAATAVVLAALGGFGLVEARESTAIADSHALVRAAQNLEKTDPPLAVMTALAAYDAAPTRESRNQLMRMYWEFRDADLLVPSAATGTDWVYSRDGDVVLIEGSQYTLEVLTGVLSGRPARHRVQLTEPLRYAALTPDGRRVVVFHDDGSGVWFDIDPTRSAVTWPVRRLPDPAVPRTPPEDQETVGGDLSLTMEGIHGWSVNVEPAISADGRHVAARVWGRIVVWDLAQGSGGAVTHRVPAVDKMHWNLWFGPDPKTLIMRVGDGGRTDRREHLVSVDVETGAVRDVTPIIDEMAEPGDGHMMVTCRKQGGRLVFERYRAADGTRAGTPYVRNSEAKCPSGLTADASARFLYLAPELIDLERGEVISRPAISVSGKPLFEHDGKLYGAANVGGARAYVEVPRSGENGQAAFSSRISEDGTRLYSVLRDGRLLVRSLAPETYGDDLAVTQRLKPTWNFEGGDRLEFDRTGTRLLQREGRDVVTVRNAKTLKPVTTIKARRPPVFEPASELFGVADPGPATVPAATSDFVYFFDGDAVITVSGTVVQRWNANTGKEITRLDIARFRPKAGKEDLQAGPSPRPGTIAVNTVGQPGVSLVDLASGRTVETIDTPDTVAAQFDPSGRYMALLRSGSILELWSLDPPRKEIGPLPSIVESARVPFVAGFSGDGGRYLLGTRNTLSVYEIEEGGLVDSYHFGDPTADEGNGAFMDVTKSLSHVIRIDPDGTGGPISLAPATWQKRLCEILGGRDFTAEELGTLPDSLQRGRLCTGNDASGLREDGGH